MTLYERTSDDAELEALTRLIQQRSHRRREPRRIADAINQLLARRGYAQGRSADQLLAAWTKVAGDPLARHSRPGVLQRGVLEIVVRNSTVLQELTFQKDRMLKQLQAIEGKQVIRALRLRIGQLD